MISKRVISWLNLAIEISRQFDHQHNSHHAAVIAKGNKFISMGCNLKQTSPRSNSKYNYIHAELNALLRSDYSNLSRSSMFVARTGFINRSRIMLSRPCCFCKKIIINSPVKIVYYTINDNTIGVWDVKKGSEVKVNI